MDLSNIKYELFPLFPTVVMKFKLNRSFTKKEFSVICDQEKFKNAGNKTSLDTYILTNKKELKKIHDFAMNGLNIFLEDIICPKEKTDLYITQSWCNYTEPGEYHHLHRHPNSFLSGVLYVQANKEQDKIHFSKEKLYNCIKVEQKEFNPFNSDGWWLPVESGDLFVFHSSLQHSVEKTTSDKTRISISFNTFVKGKIGDERSLTQLILK